MSPIEVRFLNHTGIILEIEAKSDNGGETVAVRSGSVHHKLTIPENGSITISTRGQPIARLRHINEVGQKGKT